MHGANRLASNSLLEGLVLGTRVGAAAAAELPGVPPRPPRIRHATGRTVEERGVDVEDLRKSLLSCTWRHVGIVRDGSGIEEAADAIRRCQLFSGKVGYRCRTALELENLLLLAALVAAAAGVRRESRGTHWRRDFPERDDTRFLGSFLWTPGQAPVFRARRVRTRG